MMSNKLVSPRKTGPSHALLFKEDPIFINSQEEFIQIKFTYKRNQKIKFVCPLCKKESIKQIRTIETVNFNCTACNNLLAANSVEKKNAVAKTKLERYGNAGYNNQNKRLKTIGDRIYEYAQKGAKTRKKHALDDNDFEAKVEKKRQNTIIKKYGSLETFYENKSLKMKATKLKRHGSAGYNNQQKRQETLLKNGTNIFSASYFYDNEYFDSSWELLFYIYHKEHNSDIIRNKNFFIIYTDDKNKKHKYFPDFLLNNKYVEIKGNQFFDKNKNPVKFNDENWEFKYKCIIDNNIEILLKEDLNYIFQYLADKYTFSSKKKLFTEWVKQFKI